MTQEALNFFCISLGVLVANSFPCNVAGKLVQIKGNSQALLACHGLVAFDLFIQGHGRGHCHNQPFCASLAQLSFKVIVRLNTSFPGALSLSKAT